MKEDIKFKTFLSRRNRPILIIKYSYIFNFISQNKKTKTEIYGCKDFKTKYYCLDKIKLKKDHIAESNNNHNHTIDHKYILREEAKKEIKNQIKNVIGPFSINLQKLVKSYSVDKGIKASSFINIKNCLYKELNKNIPNDIINLSHAPEDSLY